MNSAARRLPQLRWLPVLGGALGLFLGAAIGLEADLAHQGFRPNLADSFPLWERQRQRADRLGPRALVLVGNSRMLIDMDLGELRRDIGLEPVQLAVGGASFLPVLQDLAKDPAMSGTVLVNFEPQELEVSPRDLAASYVAERGPAPGDLPWDFAGIEASLSDEVHAHLRSYADGSRPLSALLLRSMDTDATPQYVTMLPDREEVADFSLAKLPRLYYVRAVHEFRFPPAIPPGMRLEQQRDAIEAAIAALRPDDPRALRTQLPHLTSLVDAIQRHGGRVIFIRLPRSGYLREIDAKRFPRTLFWDPLAALPGIQSLDYEDVPALTSFVCPDGSHLDYRDRERFTQALAAALGPRLRAR